MSKRTMRLVRTLSNLKRARRCTALRAAAELAALAAQDSEPEPPLAQPDPPAKRDHREITTEPNGDCDLIIYTR